MKRVICYVALGAMFGCHSAAYEYNSEQDDFTTQIKLFEDSTFVALVIEGVEQHSYAGYWRGRPEEGRFKAIATRDGFDILENEIQMTFQVSGTELKVTDIDTLAPKY